MPFGVRWPLALILEGLALKEKNPCLPSITSFPYGITPSLPLSLLSSLCHFLCRPFLGSLGKMVPALLHSNDHPFLTFFFERLCVLSADSQAKCLQHLGWVTPESGARNSVCLVCVCGGVGRDPTTWDNTCYLPGCTLVHIYIRIYIYTHTDICR